MRILLVDDDTRLLAEEERILTRYGHAVECVTNADDGVEKCRMSHYDFVLVDYRMPEHDGMWFMRNASIAKGTKVLLVTSYTDRNMIRQMFHAGIAGYVTKPFDEAELLMHLKFHSDKHGNATETQYQEVRHEHQH